VPEATYPRSPLVTALRSGGYLAFCGLLVGVAVASLTEGEPWWVSLWLLVPAIVIAVVVLVIVVPQVRLLQVEASGLRWRTLVGRRGGCAWQEVRRVRVGPREEWSRSRFATEQRRVLRIWVARRPWPLLLTDEWTGFDAALEVIGRHAPVPVTTSSKPNRFL
jgi:hypothetical protein